MVLSSFKYATTCVLKSDFNITTSSGLHEADEADDLKRVTTAEGVEGGREALAPGGCERLVNLIGDRERDEVREVGAGEFTNFSQLF